MLCKHCSSKHFLDRQDPSGQLHLRLLFMDRPSHSALSLRPGHCVAVAGVAVPERLAPADKPLQATWTEVLHWCRLHPMSMFDTLISCALWTACKQVHSVYAAGITDGRQHLVRRLSRPCCFAGSGGRIPAQLDMHAGHAHFPGVARSSSPAHACTGGGASLATAQRAAVPCAHRKHGRSAVGEGAQLWAGAA